MTTANRATLAVHASRDPSSKYGGPDVLGQRKNNIPTLSSATESRKVQLMNSNGGDPSR